MCHSFQLENINVQKWYFLKVHSYTKELQQKIVSHEWFTSSYMFKMLTWWGSSSASFWMGSFIHLLRTLCAINTLLVTDTHSCWLRTPWHASFDQSTKVHSYLCTTPFVDPWDEQVAWIPLFLPCEDFTLWETKNKRFFKVLHCYRTHKTSNVRFRTIDIPLNSNAGSSMTAISLPRPWFQHRSVRCSKTKTFD